LCCAETSQQQHARDGDLRKEARSSPGLFSLIFAVPTLKAKGILWRAVRKCPPSAKVGLSVPVPAAVQGQSLVTNPKRKNAVFSEFPTIKMARTRDWKLVHYTKAKHGELYNLKEDPHELYNLWDDPKYAGNRAEMEGILFDWLSTTGDPNLAPVKDPQEK
jgi:hypothetical protein